jgi:DNA-directed RNA polymerase subunit M/transcription elongation factor TFIIS
MPKRRKIVIKDDDDSDDILTEDSIKECIEKNQEDMINSCNFITDIGKSLSIKYVIDSTKSLKRQDVVKKIDKHIKNMVTSTEIESGIFEYAVTYVHINNLDEFLVYSVYIDKTNDIIDNIDNKNIIKNNYLKKNIMNKKLNPKHIAFLRPEEIFPDNWEFYIRKNNLRKYKEENLAATDNYTCKKCKESRCKVTQLQLRSADEPMTNIVECLVCGFTFKC